MPATRTGAIPHYRPADEAARPGVGLRDLVSALVMLGGVAACAYFIHLLLRAPSQPAPVAAVPAASPAWIDIPRPIHMFALQAPEYGREPRLYEARRHVAGGGRQDVLTYGAEPGEGPMLRLGLYRIGSEEASASPFFVELARSASLAGLSVVRSAQPVPLASKFGMVESSDVVLASGPVMSSCLAFRMQATDITLRISGFACGPPVPDRAALSCTLDRLDLVSAGDDAPLMRFFTAAELARGKQCPTGRPPGARNTSLESAGRPQPLRNAPASR